MTAPDYTDLIARGRLRDGRCPRCRRRLKRAYCDRCKRRLTSPEQEIFSAGRAGGRV